MNTPSPSTRKSRIVGWARFGIAIASVLSGLLSLVGIAPILISIVAVVDSASNGSDLTVPVVILVSTIAVAVGFGWLTVYLNGKLKQGAPPDPNRPNPFACQVCGDEAPTIHAGLHRHIGMIVLMNHRSLKGRFCKPCFMHHFWGCTLTTLFLGWWGIISCIITPVVLVNNFVMLVRSFTLGGKPPGSTRPTLNEQQLASLQPQRETIARRLASGATEESIAIDVANSSGLTPGQAYLFVRPLADGSIEDQPSKLESRPKAPEGKKVFVDNGREYFYDRGHRRYLDGLPEPAPPPPLPQVPDGREFVSLGLGDMGYRIDFSVPEKLVRISSEDYSHLRGLMHDLEGNSLCDRQDDCLAVNPEDAVCQTASDGTECRYGEWTSPDGEKGLVPLDRIVAPGEFDAYISGELSWAEIFRRTVLTRSAIEVQPMENESNVAFAHRISELMHQERTAESIELTLKRQTVTFSIPVSLQAQMSNASVLTQAEALIVASSDDALRALASAGNELGQEETNVIPVPESIKPSGVNIAERARQAGVNADHLLAGAIQRVSS